MSLRWRLFLTFALVVVLCLGLVAISATVILQSQRDLLAMERLSTMATPIAVQVRSLVNGQITVADLQVNLKEQAQNNDVYIIFSDNKGNILTQITPGSGAQRLEVAPAELPHSITQSTQGKFVTTGGETFIYTAFPLTKTTIAQALTRFDTLVLAVQGTKAFAVMKGFTSPFVVAGLIVLVISLIISILFARSIYRPINRVKAAAEKMAEGQYDQEIPLTGPKEIRELAATFNGMAGQVKRSQYQLRHFVADVSHQLKSPLTSIHGFAQALLDGTAGDEASRQKAASIICDESKRMKRQVDELLELARMQAGQLKMEYETININELLEHCREVFEVQAEEKKVNVKIYAELLSSCSGDFDRLEQVFSNILDNAIKNSPDEGEVKIIGRNLDNYLIEVRVVDNGPGIPPEQLPYLFERFYQTSSVRSGFGLGLAIAREIVIAHGGTIEAKSEPGEGAEFVIRLLMSRPSKLV
ncbi:MAG: HAMP domain-containing sensor histidine kinase [Dehalococcoidales bacterium]|nr:HAMP domain-containing sensor histidine kinase [Dehalococcoidales bacterium]